MERKRIGPESILIESYKQKIDYLWSLFAAAIQHKEWDWALELGKEIGKLEWDDKRLEELEQRMAEIEKVRTVPV